MAIVFESLAAFLGLFLAQGDGGSFALGDAGPPIIGAVELRGVGFAGAVGLAAGAAGGGDAARQQGALAGEDDFSSLYLDSTAVKTNTERPTDSGLITKSKTAMSSAGCSGESVRTCGRNLRKRFWRITFRR